jgi:hypothetical protein
MIVEVFNASGRAGLGRVGTRVLRREGIDVVALGTVSDGETLDTTRIVVRRGSLAAATAIRNALGVGRVLMQPDSTRLLDASVFLGGDFSPRLEFTRSVPVQAARAVHPTAAAQHHMHAAALEPLLEREHALTRAGGEVGRASGVERQEIHQRAERCGEGGQLIGQFGCIVPSPDQHVFERHPPAKLLQRAEDFRQPVLLFDRHQLEPQRRRGRVQ